MKMARGTTALESDQIVHHLRRHKNCVALLHLQQRNGHDACIWLPYNIDGVHNVHDWCTSAVGSTTSDWIIDIKTKNREILLSVIPNHGAMRLQDIDIFILHGFFSCQ
jgi:hypothetical protein